MASADEVQEQTFQVRVVTPGANLAIDLTPTEFAGLVASPVYWAADDGEFSWHMQETQPERFQELVTFAHKLMEALPDGSMQP